MVVELRHEITPELLHGGLHLLSTRTELASLDLLDFTVS